MEPLFFKMLLFATVITASVTTMVRATTVDTAEWQAGCEGRDCIDLTEHEYLLHVPVVQYADLSGALGTERKMGVNTDREPIIYDPNVTINEPRVSTTPPCNLSAVQGLVNYELDRMAEMYARDEEEIRHQVIQLQETFADLAANIRNRRGNIPVDCTEAATRGVAESGVYIVQPQDGGAAIEVYCDMDTEGGGWTVFQRRQDGSVNFFRDFASYRRGFGDLEGEFWLGNDHLHRLTSQDEYVLRVDLTDFQENSAYASYSSFEIADPSDFYRLTIGDYSGTAGDSLAIHNDKRFTTYDVDHDDWIGNCAEHFVGAWWYAGCYKSHLNGRYVGEPYQGVAWFTWKSNYEFLKSSDMKFRTKKRTK